MLGTGALFSTAYGNVGSSIYYALGLVAVYALGMTPVVFLISGVIFAATAATYAEATAMYPEAGGSSSFARHAFNEFWSFFAAWGQMLNYIITVSISAFFVPHYLGVFWEPLRHSPGDIVGGIVIVAVLALVNVVGIREASALNIFLAIADFLTQVVLVIVGCVLVLSPHTLIHNIHLGTAPTIGNFLIAIPIGMVAYTGIETVSNLAEEARDYGRTVPRAIGGVVIAVTVIYAFLPDRGAVGHAGRERPHGAGRRVRRRPDPGRGQEPAPRRPPAGGRDLRGHPRGHDPVHRHERGPDRGVPADVLDGPAPPAARGAAPAPPALSHAVHRDRGVRAHRVPHDPAGQANFLGRVYAFGAMLSFTIAHLAVIKLRQAQPDHERPYRGPGQIRIRGKPLPLFAVFGAFGTGSAWIVVTVLNLDTLVAGVAWLTIGIATYVAYRRRRGSA